MVSIDKPALIEALLYIDNKQGIVTPYRFNKVQRYFNTHKSSRNIIIKARQVGVSSSILGDMFTDCITIPHTSCAVVSHETRATQRLLDRVQFYYDTMQEPKPSIGAESRSEKTFPSMHSSIYIGTAGARAFGRGDTIRKALLSEIAFYEDGEKILSGVEDAVPITGELTLETTPNGEDNIAYEKWIKAREGKSPYKTFFFPWWWDDEYFIPRDSNLALLEDKGELVFTEEEIELRKLHPLTEGQIRWRRWKIGEKGGLFWQEYPEDEISCFITIGDPVFDPMIISHLAQGAHAGKRHEFGWEYWIPPQDKERYTIGADTSAGVPGGSYSAAVVLDSAMRVCATFMARVEPFEFASILKRMGKWYNNAELVIERNFTGYAVLGHMQDYPNVYYQHDFITGKITTQKGWWTSDQTKSFMMTKLKESFPLLKIWDMNIIRQMRGYRFVKLKPEAQTFNDLVIALGIAVAVRAAGGVARGYQGKIPGWSW